MEETINWNDDILTPLKDNNLILVLGPDFNNLRENTANAILKDERIKSRISHYDENSNIFIFNENLSTAACRATACDIKSVIKSLFSEALTEEKNIYNYISQLSFSCVINLSPDEYLKNTLDKFNYQQQYSSYLLRSAIQDSAKILHEVDNINYPVTYNLFGLYAKPNSLIVTYEDLMKFFSQIFSKPSIDDKLKEYLKIEDGTQASPKQFIFLGFRYESWHMQLIMQLLNIHMHNEPANLNLNNNSKIPGSIILQQIQKYFHINNQLYNEIDFIKKLYEECQASQPDCIRYTQLIEFWKRVEPLVNAGFIDEVFNEMSRRNNKINLPSSSNFENQITSLKTEYKGYVQSNDADGIKSIQTRLIDLAFNNKERLL